MKIFYFLLFILMIEPAFAQDALIKKGETKKRFGAYSGSFEMGMIYGNSKKKPNIYYDTQDDFGISAHTVHGYRFWPYLFVGAGVGIDRFVTYQETFSPFYLRLKSVFLKKNVSPYLYTDFGYNLMWKHKSEQIEILRSVGGVYLMTGGGIEIKTASLINIQFGVSYKMSQSNYDWKYKNSWGGDYFYNIQKLYHRAVFHAGFSF